MCTEHNGVCVQHDHTANNLNKSVSQSYGRSVVTMASGTTWQSPANVSSLPSGLEKRLPRLDSISLGTPDGSNLSEAATPDLSEMISTMDVSGISRLANYGDDSREDLSLGKDLLINQEPTGRGSSDFRRTTTLSLRPFTDRLIRKTV